MFRTLNALRILPLRPLAAVNLKAIQSPVAVKQLHCTQIYLKKGGSKPNKGGGGKKQDLDDILDHLGVDDEDEKSKGNVANIMPNPNSPVNKFIKGKSKGGKSASKMISYDSVIQFCDIDAVWSELDALVEDQKLFYVNHVTLRSASAIDEMPIEFEGYTFPLREIADVSKADPKRVIIDCSAIPQAAKIIMETLQGSKSMNLNPQQDGTRIFVPVPKVTKESREQLAKSAQATMKDTIEKLRKTTNKKIKDLNDAEMTGKLIISKDDFKGTQELIRQIESHFASLAKEMCDKKQKDVLNK